MQVNLTYPEAAERLRMSLPVLKRLVKFGNVPHVKIGRLVLFPVDVLDEWIAEKALRSLQPSPPVTPVYPWDEF